jgi:Na+-driven multidrug efflux pump
MNWQDLPLRRRCLALVVAGTNFLAYGTTERVANARGASDVDRSTSFARHALMLGALIGIFCVCCSGILFADNLISLLGAGEEVSEHGTRYLTIAAFGLPAVVVMIAAQGVLRGHSDYRRPFVVLMVSNILNAAHRDSTRLVGGLVYCRICVLNSDCSVRRSNLACRDVPTVPWPESTVCFAFSTIIAIDLLRVGRDLGIRVGSMLAIFTASTVLAARSGDDVLAAHQIVNGTFLLLALCLDAISIPAHTLLGESTGSGQRSTQSLIASRVYFWSAMIGLGIARSYSSCLPVNCRCSSLLMTLFVTLHHGGLRLLAIALVPGAIAFGGDGILIGLSDNSFLGIAAFAHTVLDGRHCYFSEVRQGPGLAVIWALLGGWMTIRAVTVVLRSRALLRA